MQCELSDPSPARQRTITQRVEAFTRLMNVTDRLYATQVFDGSGEIDRFYDPAEPRTFYAGLHARF